jgi:hypothetical protein
MKTYSECAEYLLESRGEAGARKFIVHCANRTTDGFWSRVNQAFEALVEANDAKEEAREASNRRASGTA